jgi:predicted GIY-YIG superfamily endonuclease
MSAKNKPRNWFRYHIIWRRKVVHRGITRDLARREVEHRQHWRGGRIRRIGPAVTHESALRWEEEGGKRV